MWVHSNAMVIDNACGVCSIAHSGCVEFSDRGMAVLREPSRPAERPFGQRVFRTVCNIEHSVESRLDYRASMRRTTRAFPCALLYTPQMSMQMLSAGKQVRKRKGR